MTIKELIKRTAWWLEQFADLDDVHWEGQERREHRENVEEHRLILKLAENAEKYRWHDLRKNPEDLPDGRWVMCACHGRNNQVMRMSPSGEWLTWYPETATFVHGFVLAWREIEPFEGE